MYLLTGISPHDVAVLLSPDFPECIGHPRVSVIGHMGGTYYIVSKAWCRGPEEAEHAFNSVKATAETETADTGGPMLTELGGDFMCSHK